MNQSNMKSNKSKHLLKVGLMQEELRENANLQLYREVSLNLLKHGSAYYYFFAPLHGSENDDVKFHSHAYVSESANLTEKNFL